MTSKIEVRNPRSGEIDFWIDPVTSNELAEIAERLRSNQPAWLSMGLDRRSSILLEWKESIEEHRGALVETLVQDTGRLTESELEVGAITGSIERWCRLGKDLLAEEPARPASIPAVSVRQSMAPYPLVGAISPWNFPLLLSLIDAIPALVVGCAVIVKPSEIAPRFIEPLNESMALIPELAGVLSYVAGDGKTGEALIDEVDAVCFTGSVATGRSVAERAAARFIPAFLELGGKDPAVVLASADLDRATSAILWGSTANAGQACQSIERVYVDQSIADVFVEMLVSKAEDVDLAVPNPGSGQIGPIIAAKQIAVIREHLEDAASRGAKVLTGGSIEEVGGGAYLRPTVMTGVGHSMKIMTEETFGPIIPVMTFESIDEAIELANDSQFGLSAAVFAGSTDEALEVARKIKAGAVSINDAALTALVYDAEKNSFNFSGLGGSRMGPAALRRFGRRQAFLVSETDEPDPWWHPSLKNTLNK